MMINKARGIFDRLAGLRVIAAVVAFAAVCWVAVGVSPAGADDAGHRRRRVRRPAAVPVARAGGVMRTLRSARRTVVALVALFVGVGLVIQAAAPASAAVGVYRVNTPKDDTVPGACEASPGDCTLREAMVAASGDGNPSVIIVDTSAVTSPILLQGPVVHTEGNSLQIDGHGVTVRQTTPDAGVIRNTGTGRTTITAATIAGGNGAAGEAGGVYGGGAVVLNSVTVTGNATTSPGGAGGVYSGAETLEVSSSTVSGNQGTAFGGVFALNEMLISSSTVANNTASAATGEAVGGVSAQKGGLSLGRSTVIGNRASTGAGTAVGGVLASGSLPSPLADLTQTTVADNTGASGNGNGVGGVEVAGQQVTLLNSTVSGNSGMGTGTGTGGVSARRVIGTYSTVVENTGATAANVSVGADGVNWFGSAVAVPAGGGANCAIAGVIQSNGYNYEQGDDSCGFTNAGSGDRQNAGDPMLGALADNGGPTPTRLPASGSALVNAIPTASCDVTLDQRGSDRPDASSPNCDIGAVEGAAPPAPPPPPASSPPPREPSCAAAVPGITGGTLLGAEGVVASLPLGIAAWWRRRRRGAAIRSSGRARSVVTTVLVTSVAVVVLAGCVGGPPPGPPPGC